jgi:hypothetical protein
MLRISSNNESSSHTHPAKTCGRDMAASMSRMLASTSPSKGSSRTFARDLSRRAGFLLLSTVSSIARSSNCASSIFCSVPWRGYGHPRKRPGILATRTSSCTDHTMSNPSCERS